MNNPTVCQKVSTGPWNNSGISQFPKCLFDSFPNHLLQIFIIWCCSHGWKNIVSLHTYRDPLPYIPEQTVMLVPVSSCIFPPTGILHEATSEGRRQL